MSTNVFQFTADNIRLDIIRKFKGQKYFVRISLILFKLSRIFSHLNQEIFYFVPRFISVKILFRDYGCITAAVNLDISASLCSMGQSYLQLTTLMLCCPIDGVGLPSEALGTDSPLTLDEGEF